MGLFSKTKKIRPAQAARDAGMDVRFQIVTKEGTKDIDIFKMNGPVEKGIRKVMDNYIEKLFKKYGDLVHPETNERPSIIFFVPKPGSTSVQIRIVTDSEKMRAWLKEKGLDVHGEVVQAPAEKASTTQETADV